MWKTFDTGDGRLLLTTAPEGLLIGVALAGYLPVLALALTVSSSHHWPLWISIMIATGYVGLAVAAVVLERRARRRLVAAAEGVFAQHADQLRASMRMEPDTDLRLTVGELGFLADGQRGALLAAVAWLRAARSIRGHKRDARVQTAARAAPAEMDQLTSALYAAAGEHPFGATYRPAGFELEALHETQPSRPLKVFRVLEQVRDELQAAGLWNQVDLPDRFPDNSARTMTAASVGLLGTPTAIALMFNDGFALAFVVLVAQAVVLLRGYVYPRTSYVGPTPSGELALTQARDRHLDLDPANPAAPAATPQPARLATAVAVFGVEALAGHDDKLRSIVAAGGFHQTFTEQGDGMDPGQ